MDLGSRDIVLGPCIIQVAKTKALISFAVTAQLICVFVFAYAEHWCFTTQLNNAKFNGCKNDNFQLYFSYIFLFFFF